MLATTLAGGLYILPQQAAAKTEKAEQPAIPAQPVGIGALGKIEPRSRVLKISHNAGPEGAKILTLMVDEAQNVDAGDALAVLADYKTKKAEMAQAEANVKALEASLKIEELRAEYAQKDFDRAQKLDKEKAISLAESEKFEQAIKQAKASVDNIAAQIESAQANYAISQENLAKMVIRAPISGTILRIISRAGERLDGNGLLEMADLSQLDTVAEVYERDIPGVHIGQSAEINIAGLPEIYHGKVREIGFQVRGNDLNDTDPLADRDNRVISVRITMDDAAIPALRHQIYRQVQVTIKP